MEIKLDAKELNGSTTTVICDRVPDFCPRCHRSVHPKVVQSTYQPARRMAQVVYQCTSDACLELFVGTYIYDGTHRSGHPEFKLKGVAPMRAKGAVFPESVLEVSESFVEIHNQALAAESQGLTQLVGIGLRKALEFLIKDFAMNQHPEDVEKIKGKQLGPCIDAFVSDANVKECAKRAAWLGNDETHYVRKWEDKDISDLKLLVRLTTNWIDNVLLTQKYVAQMHPAKP